MGTAATSSPPILAQVAGISVWIDRQEAMLEAILEHFSDHIHASVTTSTPAAGVLLAQAAFTTNTNVTA
jgi:hypothetical protein